MKKTIGVLAHVDAGKTTFSEQVLYRAGAIRALGRVDHRDAFLDAHPIERARGITVFSDQAVFELGGDTIFWLDTPGHVDFSPEMERAIAAMDYAVVVVSCVEGVQSHTETVWHLLEKRGIPVFFFLNKVDRAGADREAVLAEIRERLTPDAIDLEAPGLSETVAERDEAFLECFLAGTWEAAARDAALCRLIRARAVFPVRAGAALTGAGIAEFLDALSRLTPTEYGARLSEPFSARVYKIRHDPQGARVCFFKVLTGAIAVRDEIGGEKITELRRYHGAKYRTVPRAEAGELCAAVGLSGARPGDMLGAGKSEGFSAEPMLRGAVLYPPEVRKEEALAVLRMIEDEEPTLSVESDASGLSISVMGEVQLEVLRDVARERFHMQLAFGEKKVLYLETIQAPAIGIGHFEPLRHYAEVHVRLLPGARGSGVRFRSRCHVDDLPLQYQRLIETHVFETRHGGALMGAPLTDVTVELLAGAAHTKHTQGGDFREATCRAIQCALRNAQGILLEPWCAFSVRAPAEFYGKLAGDLTRMRARCAPPTYARDLVMIEGEASFREISGYGTQLTAIAHGRGALSYRLSHYEPARDWETIVENSGCDARRAESAADSVFCQNGAGHNVGWRDVPLFAHCPQEYPPPGE